MYNPIYMSNNFLILAHRHKEHVTAMKMQKMLYFLYRDYLQETGDALFSERFSTWKYGPVLESVYHTYKKFGSSRIRGYGGIPAYSIRDEDDPILERLIKKVWTRCLLHNGIYLSVLTHRQGGAWRKAWDNGLRFLLDDDIKTDQIEIA